MVTPMAVPTITPRGTRKILTLIVRITFHDFRSAPIPIPTRNMSMYNAYMLKSVFSRTAGKECVIPRISPRAKKERMIILPFMV
jgi:hypothetical protein